MLLKNFKQKYNVDLERASGQTHHILPIPSVFILNGAGTIVFVHADPDYKVRMKGAEVLAAAKTAVTTSDSHTVSHINSPNRFREAPPTIERRNL